MAEKDWGGIGKTLVTGGILLTGQPGDPPLYDGYVLVDGNVITEVGSGYPDGVQAEEVIDASEMLVIPGLVNAHTHLCMIYGRGLGRDHALLHWLADAQVPLMRALEPEDYELSMELGAIENLKAGSTTLCEVFFSPHYDQDVDQLATEVLDSSGIRSTFFRCTNDESFFEGFLESRKEIVERSDTLISQWESSARTNVGIGPLVPWGSTEAAFREAAELSAARQISLHLHTAETPEYNELVRERTGKSNVEMLAEVGALGPSCMLNHCVHLTERDIDLITETQSPVIHDPTSNMLLASGIAPVPQLHDAGVSLGLACDGPACNNTQDMIKCMKDAALLQKVSTRRAEALVAEDVFHMATHGGAKALGKGNYLGLLKAGYIADLTMIDLRSTHLTPLHDPLAALVYSASGADVHTVLVDGKVVVRNGEITTINEERVRARVAERARRAHEQM